MTTSRRFAPEDLAAVLPPGGLTLVSGTSAESALLDGAVRAAGPALGSMAFCGTFIPGLNRATWDAGPSSELITFFRDPALRRSGPVRFLPLCYDDQARFLADARPAALLAMVSPPDAEGNCSFGTEVGWLAQLWPDVPVRIAHINPAMPRTPGDPGIPFAQLTAWCEGTEPLRTSAIEAADPVSLAIARNVAMLVPDGAALQVGIGRIPDAVLRALTGHRDLRLHSGMLGDGALELVRSPAIAPGRSATVGVAIGSAPLYAGLDHPRLQFRPPAVTHALAALAGVERLVTINSAMAVDLYGQVYAESSARGFVSGPGGASDYARGGRASPGGLRIIALPATTRALTRIVAPGDGIGPVSLSRFDVDVVVTEHGAADLRGRDPLARAAALVAIADPAHREALDRARAALAAQL